MRDKDTRLSGLGCPWFATGLARAARQPRALRLLSSLEHYGNHTCMAVTHSEMSPVARTRLPARPVDRAHLQLAHPPKPPADRAPCTLDSRSSHSRPLVASQQPLPAAARPVRRAPRAPFCAAKAARRDFNSCGCAPPAEGAAPRQPGAMDKAPLIRRLQVRRRRQWRAPGPRCLRAAAIRREPNASLPSSALAPPRAVHPCRRSRPSSSGRSCW